DERLLRSLADLAAAGWRLWKAHVAADLAAQRKDGDLSREAAALDETHRELTATLEHMSDGFVTFDRQWRYISVNPAGARIIGRTAAALLGCDVRAILAEEGEVLRHFERCLQQNAPLRFDHRSTRTGRWYESRCHPSPVGLSVFFSDVTDRKAA